jgi:hypothetical protein
MWYSDHSRALVQEPEERGCGSDQVKEEARWFWNWKFPELGEVELPHGLVLRCCCRIHF